MSSARFDPSGPLRGDYVPPADKSISHRAALFAAMSDEPVTVRNYLESQDTRSTLDALLNVPMERVVKKLPLAQELQEALLEGRGPMGEALSCTLAYERGAWDEVECFGLSRAVIKQAFLDAVVWVEAVDLEIAAVRA